MQKIFGFEEKIFKNTLKIGGEGAGSPPSPQKWKAHIDRCLQKKFQVNNYKSVGVIQFLSQVKVLVEPKIKKKEKNKRDFWKKYAQGGLQKKTTLYRRELAIRSYFKKISCVWGRGGRVQSNNMGSLQRKEYV